MVATEELLNSRLEKERAVIIEAVTKVVHEQMRRDHDEARNMLEQLKAIGVEVAKLNELMRLLLMESTGTASLNDQGRGAGAKM
jgi:hypothetical protein